MTSEKWLSAQASVIGSALIDPAAVPVILGGVGPQDFSGQFRTLFDAISGLFTEQIAVDPVTVLDRIGGSYKEIIKDLMLTTPTAAHVGEYMRICREQSRLCRAAEIGEALQNADTLDALRTAAEQLSALTVETTGERVTPLQGIIKDFYDRHHSDAPTDFLDMGIQILREKILIPAGRGKYVLLGGYPSDGKSALMLQLALAMAQTKRVGVFSLETDADTFGDRLIAHTSQTDVVKIIKNDLRLDDWQRIQKSGSDTYRLPIDFIDASGMTAGDIAGLTLAKRYDVIFVDYIQLIEPDDRFSSRAEAVAGISRKLQRLAKRSGVTVIALAQLTRPEKRKDGTVPAPTLQSFRESGQLEQDADIALLLYREDSTDPHSPRLLKLAKNKEGPTTDAIRLEFNGKTQIFYRKEKPPMTPLEDPDEELAKMWEGKP